MMVKVDLDGVAEGARPTSKNITRLKYMHT